MKIDHPSAQRFLVLDDDPIRHETWARFFKAGGHESVHAHNIDEFEVALETGRFDIIFLDHDLNDHPHLWKSYGRSTANPFRAVFEPGDEMFLTPGSNIAKMPTRKKDGTFYQTGQDACGLICLMPEDQKPGRVIIHSWNDSGAMAMEYILRNEAGIKDVIRKEFPINLYYKEAHRAYAERGYLSPLLRTSRATGYMC